VGLDVDGSTLERHEAIEVIDIVAEEEGETDGGVGIVVTGGRGVHADDAGHSQMRYGRWCG
jgi:hypothetical protein